MEIYNNLEQKVVAGHNCDVCGNTCHKTDEPWSSEEIAHLMANWGYNSDKDRQTHHCDICESCYDKIVAFIESLGGKVQVSKY